MASYDSRFKPPAPLALVTFFSADRSAHVNDVPMLIDTGADGSVVPLSIVNQLGVRLLSDKALEIEGYDGSKNIVNLAMLEMDFCEQIFTGEFILLDQSIGIVGRNVLNLFNLNFNGPKLTWNETP